MSIKKKIVGFSLLMIVVIITIVLNKYPIYQIYQYKWSPSYPKDENITLEFEEVISTTEIKFDQHGIPHVKASNNFDLALALGLAHGRHRFFQMDLVRRLADGTLAELLGNKKIGNKSILEIDLSHRAWGLTEQIQSEYDSLDDTELKLLKHYSIGVNRALNKYLPIEYKILKIDPKKWKPRDTLAIAIYQSWSLSFNWKKELIRLGIVLEKGIDQAEKLFPFSPLSFKPSLSEGKYYKKDYSIDKDLLLYLESWKENKTQKIKVSSSDQYQDFDYFSAVSNVWALKGSKSNSGGAMLASDPHLRHRLPGIFYLQHYTTPEINFIGVTIPGIPFSVMGKGKNIAYGQTIAFGDTIDLLVLKDLENINCPISKKKITISHRESNQLVSNEFMVRQNCDSQIILNDYYPKLIGEYYPLLTYRWKKPKLAGFLSGILKANAARDLEELQAALFYLESPITNIGSSSQVGDIKLFTNGYLPKRKNYSGMFPIPYWKKEHYSSSERISLVEMPSSKNPLDYVVNANNRIVDDQNYPWAIFHDGAPDFRQLRILELLKRKNKFNVEDLMEMQTDTTVLRAKVYQESFKEDLKNAKNLSGLGRKVLNQIINWDLNANKESREALLFFEIMKTISRDLVTRSFSKNLADQFLNHSKIFQVFDHWIKNKGHLIWDDPKTELVENRSDYLKKYWNEHVEKIMVEQKGKINKPWSESHQICFKHPFGSQNVLNFFNIPCAGIGGGIDSVWKTRFNLFSKNPYQIVSGPAFRMVVDWNNLPAHFMIDTGNSGWPLDPFYSNFFKLWKEKQLLKISHQDINAASSNIKLTKKSGLK